MTDILEKDGIKLFRSSKEKNDLNIFTDEQTRSLHLSLLSCINTLRKSLPLLHISLWLNMSTDKRSNTTVSLNIPTKEMSIFSVYKHEGSDTDEKDDNFIGRRKTRVSKSLCTSLSDNKHVGQCTR